MKSPFRLDNRIALITGGSSGIGEATARAFTRAGASVIILGVRRRFAYRATKGAVITPHSSKDFSKNITSMRRKKSARICASASPSAAWDAPKKWPIWPYTSPPTRPDS